MPGLRESPFQLYYSTTLQSGVHQGGPTFPGFSSLRHHTQNPSKQSETYIPLAWTQEAFPSLLHHLFPRCPQGKALWGWTGKGCSLVPRRGLTQDSCQEAKPATGEAGGLDEIRENKPNAERSECRTALMSKPVHPLSSSFSCRFQQATVFGFAQLNWLFL